MLNEPLGARVSEFEVLTSIAIMIFKKVKLDIVVKDVGMGGMPDAINAVADQAHVVPTLTSIDFDHQGFL